MALQSGLCRASVLESLYYLGSHPPSLQGQQTSLRAIVQLPLVALEARPPRADPSLDLV